MPLVFIHGVNTRPGPDYDRAVRQRDAMFREFLGPALRTKPEDLKIISPMWGTFGASTKWNYDWLPDSDQQTLGGETDEAGESGYILGASVAQAAASGPGNVLRPLTERQGLAAAIDVLFATRFTAEQLSEQEASELAKAAVRASAYADRHPIGSPPAWLASVTSDVEFAERLDLALSAEAGPDHALGLGDWIGESVSRLGSLVEGAISTPGVQVLRAKLHQPASRFLGDILTYLAYRDRITTEHPIVQTVQSALNDGHESRRPGVDPNLAVVAHSLGGIVTYDVLTHYSPNIPVEVLMTIGSQIAVFEDLKLFKASDPDIPGRNGEFVHGPSSVKAWINVYDLADWLAFDVTDVFQGVDDYRYATGMSALDAHGGYFDRPSFYRRLADRVALAMPAS